VQTPSSTIPPTPASQPKLPNISAQASASLTRQASLSFAPYGYLSSDNKQADHPADSIYNPHPAHYWLLPNTTHEDFSDLPLLAAQIKRAGVADPPRYITLTIDWFDHYLKGLPARFPPDSPYPVFAPHSITDVAARIVDSKDSTPLAYVNVGIPGKNLGTVTREDGGFNLTIDLQAANDSLSISMTGYECRIFPIKKLPQTIALRRSTKTLDEVVVTSRSRKIRKLGNTTHSRFMSVGFPLRFLGAEIGIRIKLGKQAVKLRTFHCNVSDSRIDTALFRLNIYTLETGTPQNILKQDIFLPIGKRTGEYAIDLTGQNLVQKGDILISLELIRGSSPTTGAANPGALFFSAALLNSATWRRATSQAAWKKASGIGVGFNIEVQ